VPKAAANKGMQDKTEGNSSHSESSLIDAARIDDVLKRHVQ